MYNDRGSWSLTALPLRRFASTGAPAGRLALALATTVLALGSPRVGRAQNVGIGTTQPTQTLDVNGSTRVRGLSGSGVRVVTADDNGNLSTAPLGSGGTGSTGGNYIQNQTTVQPGANFNIDGNGVVGKRLGIGINSPSAALDVYNGEFRLSPSGGAPAPAQVSQPSSNATVTATGLGPGQSFYVPLGARITQIDVYVAPGGSTSGTFYLREYSPSLSSNVVYTQSVTYTTSTGAAATSIVLPTPTDPLLNQQYSFSLGSNVTAHYASSGDPYPSGQAFSNTAATAGGTGADLKFVVYYIDPGTAALYASPAGRVGIGTLFPSANLDVVGTARISGLATGGTRAVFADATGQFSAQPVPGSQNEFWNTTGNVGLAAGRFLGTTDNVEVPFRVNNAETMRLKANGAIWAGLRTNVMLGVNAGVQLDASAKANTFVGQDAGAQAIGTADNTLLGNQAGRAATGDGNTAVGSLAGASLTTGTNNTLVGTSAGQYAWSATRTVAVGSGAGKYNPGNDNIWIGYNSGSGPSSTTAGSGNVGIGSLAGVRISTGSGNVLVGQNAGETLDTGYSNVFVGSGADVISTYYAGAHNVTAIGHNARAGLDNTLVLGGTGSDEVRVGISNPYPVSRLSFGSTGNGAGSPPAARLALREGTSGEDFIGLGLVRGFAGQAYTGGLGLWGGSGSSTPPFDGNTGQKAALTVFSSLTPRVGVGTYDPSTLLSNTDDGPSLLPSDNVAPGSSALTWLTNQNSSYAAVLANIGTGSGANGLAVKVDGTGGAATTALLVSKAPSGGTAAPLLVVKANGNVGVGVVAPQAALDVNGTAQATGNVQTGANFTYASAQTRTLAVGASAFQPTGAASWQIGPGGTNGALSGAIISGGTTGASRSVYADVYLPDAATITGLSALVYDVDATYNVQVVLETISLADGALATGVPPLLPTDTSVGNAAAYQTLNLGSGAPAVTTNTGLFRYRLRFDTRDNNANLRLVHVKVTYNVVKAD